MDTTTDNSSSSSHGATDDGAKQPKAPKMMESTATAVATATTTPSSSATTEDTMTSKDYYFDSYSHFGIHEEMLKDEIRTLAYKKAIEQNPHLFEGKYVLDVGCGTGVLSLFAAKAGAKQVFAIDCSSIIEKAKEIAKANGLGDKVTFIRGKMEEITLPVEKVDIIISEWMGYALLYESMLNSVLYARDKYLAEDGILLPDKADIHISAIEDEQYRGDKIDWWDNVYGIDMSCMKEMVMKEPLVDTVDRRQVVTRHEAIYSLDVSTVTVAELSYDVPFSIQCKRDDLVHALVLHFDIDFTRCHKRVWFTTGCHGYYTHWKQSVFYLDEVLRVKEGEMITGRLKCFPNEHNPRDLNFELYVKFDGEICQAEFSQVFMMR